MHILVTGIAGLIGSHVGERLLARGDSVIGLDNLLTGQQSNLAQLREDPKFTFVEANITASSALEQIGEVDAILHLACPASPTDFTRLSADILRAGSLGTLNVVEHALKSDARLVIASTSEIYGEPLVHPQPETYWGNVNPIGPRACYDESKRFSEAVVSTYCRDYGLDAAMARFFNTYGPRMRVDDGRVVSNFIVQALLGQPLSIQGDGMQTRSFCYVDDLTRGLVALLDSELTGPVNLGNPDEFTVLELAKLILELTGSKSRMVFSPMPEDDPTRRRPDISLAVRELGFKPRVPLHEGLTPTIEYFRAILNEHP